MICFTRVHEEGGCAGTGQRSGNFIANMPRFPHPAYDDFSVALHKQITGVGKMFVQLAAEGGDSVKFDIHYLFAGGNKLCVCRCHYANNQY